MTKHLLILTSPPDDPLAESQTRDWELVGQVETTTPFKAQINFVAGEYAVIQHEGVERIVEIVGDVARLGGLKPHLEEAFLQLYHYAESGGKTPLPAPFNETH